jgi:hypothetical protein
MYLLTDDDRVIEYHGQTNLDFKVKGVLVTPNTRRVYIGDLPEILRWFGIPQDLELNPKQELQDVQGSLEKALSIF